MLINPVQIQGVSPELQPLANKPASAEKGFGDFVTESMNQVNKNIVDANRTSERFMVGDNNIEIHQVMMEMEKADLSFRYMTQVRNKILDAYNDVMRMQI